MFKINFNNPKAVGSTSLVPTTTNPVIVVVDVTSLKALDVEAVDLFSAALMDRGYYFVTIEDFDKIGFHLTKIGFEGNTKIVFCTGSETGEIVAYDASMEAAGLIDADEKVTVLGLPAVQLAKGQTVGLQAGTKVGVSAIDSMPALALQAGQSINVNDLPPVQLIEGQSINVGAMPAINIATGQKIGLVDGQSVNVGTMPAVSLKNGQSINVGTMPAVNIAPDQTVGLAAGTKIGVASVESMPKVELAPNQGVNINNVPQVAIAENQEIGLKAGSTVGIDGAIQATIANDQAIGVYPVRRN